MSFPGNSCDKSVLALAWLWLYGGTLDRLTAPATCCTPHAALVGHIIFSGLEGGSADVRLLCGNFERLVKGCCGERSMTAALLSLLGST